MKEHIAMLNKQKHEHHMMAKRVQAKGIRKMPRGAALDFIHKAKPQMLHLEISEGMKTDIALGLAEVQLQAGRHFVLEGHLQSSAWTVPATKRLMKNASVKSVIIHSQDEGGAYDADFDQR
jgi:hypothetical protein